MKREKKMSIRPVGVMGPFIDISYSHLRKAVRLATDGVLELRDNNGAYQVFEFRHNDLEKNEYFVQCTLMPSIFNILVIYTETDEIAGHKIITASYNLDKTLETANFSNTKYVKDILGKFLLALKLVG